MSLYHRVVDAPEFAALPGNIDPRLTLAAAGSRWHQTRLARGQEKPSSAPHPVPSLVRNDAAGESRF
jgi:hypothetical protein